MQDAACLLEIESIRQLKARYCRYLDAKDWVAWRNLLTDDFATDLADVGGAVINGADVFVAFCRMTLGRSPHPTVHQVHAPEIALTSATTATGVWALNDVVRLAPGLTLNGDRPLSRNLREGQWAVADKDLHSDPIAGGVFQPAVFCSANVAMDAARHAPCWYVCGCEATTGWAIRCHSDTLQTICYPPSTMQRLCGFALKHHPKCHAFQPAVSVRQGCPVKLFSAEWVRRQHVGSMCALKPMTGCALWQLDMSTVPGGYSFERFRDALSALYMFGRRLLLSAACCILSLLLGACRRISELPEEQNPSSTFSSSGSNHPVPGCAA